MGLLLFGYFWHPLRNGNGYNTWSGWLSDLGLVTIFSGLVFFIVAWWRKHNCHVYRCWRLQWHTHPGHGHPVCRTHHPYAQGRGGHLDASLHDLDSHETWNAVLAKNRLP